jgi:hypothetical protein
MYLLLVALLFICLQLPETIRQAEARLTAFLYITVHYPDKKLQYERVEFETHFGEYIVTYRDPNGNTAGFMVMPKYFPFIVSYDPFDESR